MSHAGTAPQHHDPPATGEAVGGPVVAAEISRRVNAILDSVEHEAALLREQARADAAECLEDARRRADALVAERRQRIADLSAELVAKSEAVIARLASPADDAGDDAAAARREAAARHSVDAMVDEILTLYRSASSAG